MTRRRRRASSAPQRVGSDEGLTSSRPALEVSGQGAGDAGSSTDGSADATTGPSEESAEEQVKAEPGAKVGGRHTRRTVEQTKDDTDEGWGEPGDDDASARWLRENRPPHWS